MHCYVVTADTEGAVVRNIERKENQAREMMDGMVEHMRTEMQKEVRGNIVSKSEYERAVAKGDDWIAHLGDSCEILREMPSEHIGYSIYSPPFASLYTYSNSDRDLGNCADDQEFFKHYQFIVKELYRVLKPGRLVSFHCMQLPLSKERDGVIGLKDFRGKLINIHEDAGFIYHSEACIWKDPVTAMQRTKAIGLLHKQIVKDSCMSRQGIADYLVTMRKPGVNAEPVAGMFDRYIGMDGPKGIGAPCEFCDGVGKVTSIMPDDYGTVYDCVCRRSNAATRFSIDVWQRYASPVWMDIDPSDTLQRESAREDDDERHICPLQLQVIERGMELWSNPGDTVYSPFMGIGSEGYVALRCGRRFIGSELKRSYWEQAVRNLKAAEKFAVQNTLFEEAHR